MIKEVPLGPLGMDYARDCLSQGQGPGLCACLLTLLPERLACFAPLSEHVGSARPTDFRAGGLNWPGGARSWFTGRLKHHWSEAPDGTLAIQDVWTRPGDVKPGDQATAIGDCVYYLFDGGEHTRRDAKHYLGKPTSFLFVAAFLVADKARVLQMISAGDCATLIESLAEVFVGAYDQEGFVVLRPKEAENK